MTVRRWRWMRAVLVGTAVLPAIGLALVAWVDWRDSWENAGRELDRSAEAAAEYALRLVEGQRFAGLFANDLLRGLSDAEIRAREPELHAALAALLPRVGFVQGIFVSDREDRLLVSATTPRVPQTVSVADREWTAALRAVPPPEVFISRVYRGRVDPNLFYGVNLRRSGGGNGVPEGGFDGTINVSINPDRVAEGFLAIGGAAGDITSLVRADGEVLVRSPGFQEPLPPIPPGSPLHRFAAEGVRSGRYIGSPLDPGRDNRRLLIAFRRVGDLPLYVTMARHSDLVVARWRQTALNQLAVGGPAALLLIALAWMALRRSQALERAEAALLREAMERQAAERARAAEARFRGVFESRVMGMAIFDLRTATVTAINDRLLEMTGTSRASFESGAWHWRRATPPEHLPAAEAAIATARRRGWWDPYEKEYLRPDGSRLPVRIASAPLPGEPERLVVLAQDITEQREAERRRDLLLGEINHRAKNVLSTARAALRLSRARTVEAHVREVDGRIGALAQAMSMLAASEWQSADLETLVRATLAPFLPGGEGAGGPLCRIAGPPVAIAGVAVQPLSMALHELATNAAKYGALSVHGGVLTVEWAEEPAALRLCWAEAGGPPLEAVPTTRGFGTRVLEATIRRQLGGGLAMDWLPEGLRCTLVLPAGRALLEKAAEGGRPEPVASPAG